MIKIEINKNEIIIKGHANYDTLGKDIVCAAVSSIVITTVNAIKRINDKAIDVLEHPDLLTIKIIEHEEVIDTLITNMIHLLTELAVDYPKNIKILKEEE